MSKPAQQKTTTNKTNAKTTVRNGRAREEASRIVGAVPKTAKLSTRKAAIWDDRNKLDRAHHRLYG